MPEIPDLEGYRAYFNKRLPGLTVQSAEAPIPWMARMGREEFVERMKGQVWLPAFRRAKYLLFPFESGDYLVVHSMLTGRFEYVESEGGPTVIVECMPLPLKRRASLFRDGIDIVIPPTRRVAPDALSPRAKTHNYLNLIMADLEAKSQDKDAWSVLLDANGHLAP